MTARKIAYCKIYPGIGIARLGNSPNEYFIGPEAPGHAPNPMGGFKDARGWIKRQASRFRVYAFDRNHLVIQEVTAYNAKIEWNVHLANKKGAWYKFQARYNPKQELRNQSIQPDQEPDQRTDLIIDPGSRFISGINQSGTQFNGGKFLATEVPLGELRTDEAGRLLVLGGAGHSASVKPNNPITNYANNDDWYDDTSDGPVTAKITFNNGTEFDATGAWVLVTPPNFAPHINNLVTLYEQIEEAFCQKGNNQTNEQKVLFYRDIYPLFFRSSMLAWVNNNSTRGHGPGKGGNFLNPEILNQLASNSAQSKFLREEVFKRIRVPEIIAQQRGIDRNEQANAFYMPQLSGDGGDAQIGDPHTWLTFLNSQYLKLEKWAAGEFETGDKPTTPPPFEQIPLQEQPAALNRAALEPCVGGPFYPGIEMTYIAEDPNTFCDSEPFRLSRQFNPGDITRYMALPWQADFYECHTHWWPAQRPDDVVTQELYQEVLNNWNQPSTSTTNDQEDAFVAEFANREPWARGLAFGAADDDSAGDNDMVKYWSELGFVLPKPGLNGEVVYVEQERSPLVGMNLRELFYKLINADSYPEISTKAREYVEQCLAAARAFQQNEDFFDHPSITPDVWRPFNYTKEAFHARLNDIYNDLVNDFNNYDPATDQLFSSREDVIEKIYQFAPFNLTDGAWLRNIYKPGPNDEVRSLLFSVLMDEEGDGILSQNHSNIYLDLLHSLGIYPAPVSSRAFAQEETFLDSAFDVPAFELAISQFSDTYYPEIMGMTLWLEWSVLDLKKWALLLEYYGINSHFFVLHVGIDNALNGHAQRAVRAIEIYLDQVLAEDGEPAMQEQWHRIWDGLVAFATTGTLGDDLTQKLTHQPSLKERLNTEMIAMIKRKAPFGSLNHGHKMLGFNRINDWFEDPQGLLNELVKSGMIIPGDPDNSPMFKLFDFQAGPMYRVFTEPELKLWADWTRSLAQPDPEPTPTTPVEDMKQLILTLGERQTGTSGHRTATLSTPDASDRHTVAEWFEKAMEDQDPAKFMAALANEDNGWIVRGQPDRSPFVTRLLSPVNSMGQAVDDVIPHTNGKTGRQIAINWINAGCPLPGQPTEIIAAQQQLHLPLPTRPMKPMMLCMPHQIWQAYRDSAKHPLGRIYGMGAIH